MKKHILLLLVAFAGLVYRHRGLKSRCRQFMSMGGGWWITRETASCCMA